MPRRCGGHSLLKAKAIRYLATAMAELHRMGHNWLRLHRTEMLNKTAWDSLI